MRAYSNTDELTISTALSQQQKDALLGEILGDVLKLYKSVKDLSEIVRDADERISARLVELRKVSAEFANAREAAFAQIGLQARNQAQQAFVETMGARLSQLDSVVQAVPRTIGLLAHRRFSELVAVSIATSLVASISTLVGVWLMVH